MRAIKPSKETSAMKYQVVQLNSATFHLDTIKTDMTEGAAIKLLKALRADGAEDVSLDYAPQGSCKRQIGIAIAAVKRGVELYDELESDDRDRSISEIQKEIDINDDREQIFCSKVQKFFYDRDIIADEFGATTDEARRVSDYLESKGFDRSYAWIFGNGDWC